MTMYTISTDTYIKPSTAADTFIRNMGFVTGPADTLAEEVGEDETEEAASMILYAGTHYNTEDTAKFYTKITALVLPCLFATCAWTVRDVMAADSALWWTTLRELLNNVFIEAEEMITRFAREHRKEALQMYKTLYERVVYAEDPQVRIDFGGPLWRMARIIGGTADKDECAPHRLRGVSRRAEDIARSWVPPHQHRMEWNLALAHITDANNGITPVSGWTDWPRGASEDPRIFVFKGCEFTRATGDRSCEDKHDLEDMDMCARCQTVRYCSAEHQRADWKRHKAKCCKPTW